ncbi:hypothetical protein C9F07_01725, partial [Salmonella enterica subsp. enterica serovar Poona]
LHSTSRRPRQRCISDRRIHDRLLMEETGIPVVVAEDPLTCVARGGGKALEMIDMHGGARCCVE